MPRFPSKICHKHNQTVIICKCSRQAQQFINRLQVYRFDGVVSCLTSAGQRVTFDLGAVSESKDSARSVSHHSEVRVHQYLTLSVLLQPHSPRKLPVKVSQPTEHHTSIYNSTVPYLSLYIRTIIFIPYLLITGKTVISCKQDKFFGQSATLYHFER